MGAVYLYDGASGAMISMLTGSMVTTIRLVHGSGVTVAEQRNYFVIQSILG